MAVLAQPAKLPNLVMILQDDLGYYGASSCDTSAAGGGRMGWIQGGGSVGRCGAGGGEWAGGRAEGWR